MQANTIIMHKIYGPVEWLESVPETPFLSRVILQQDYVNNGKKVWEAGMRLTVGNASLIGAEDLPSCPPPGTVYDVALRGRGKMKRIYGSKPLSAGKADTIPDIASDLLDGL